MSSENKHTQSSEERQDNIAKQHANARGEQQNEQGRASFVAGSTTGGGSDFGQGSGHLGAESYRQGHLKTAGANYDNEKAGLAISSSDATAENTEFVQIDSTTSARNSDTQLSDTESRGQGDEDKPESEGDRKDTSLEEASNLKHDNTTSQRFGQSGAWSDASSNQQ